MREVNYGEGIPKILVNTSKLCKLIIIGKSIKYVYEMKVLKCVL